MKINALIKNQESIKKFIEQDWQFHASAFISIITGQNKYIILQYLVFSFLISSGRAKRGTGYGAAGLVRDVVTKTVMAVRVKEFLHACEVGKSIMEVFLVAGFACANKLVVAGVPTARERAIILCYIKRYFNITHLNFLFNLPWATVALYWRFRNALRGFLIALLNEDASVVETQTRTPIKKRAPFIFFIFYLYV